MNEQVIRTTEVAGHVGERVMLRGWVHTVRRLGGVIFLVLRDGWGTVQAVSENEDDLAVLLSGEAGAESVVELGGQPRLDLAFVDHHRRRLRHRCDHLHLRRVDLHTAGGLRHRRHHTRQLDHTLRARLTAEQNG